MTIKSFILTNLSVMMILPTDASKVEEGVRMSFHTTQECCSIACLPFCCSLPSSSLAWGTVLPGRVKYQLGLLGPGSSALPAGCSPPCSESPCSRRGVRAAWRVPRTRLQSLPLGLCSAVWGPPCSVSLKRENVHERI